jgi:hypothetical protein
MIFLLNLFLAAIVQQAQPGPDPHLLCLSITVNFPNDNMVAEAYFHHPAFNPRQYGSCTVLLDGTLPPPLSDWRLVEINQSPDKNESKGYVVLRDEKTGGLAALRVDTWDGIDQAQVHTKPPPLRPSTRPAPPWPGIGCTMVMPHNFGKATWDGHYQANLVGGEYVAEDALGWFNDGELLPKPWDDWRVKQVFHGEHFHGPGPMETGVMLRNEKTGQTVEVQVKRIGTPARATTHPSDDLIAAAAVQQVK